MKNCFEPEVEVKKNINFKQCQCYFHNLIIKLWLRLKLHCLSRSKYKPFKRTIWIKIMKYVKARQRSSEPSYILNVKDSDLVGGFLALSVYKNSKLH